MRRSLLLTSLLLLISLALACGSDDGSETPTGQPPSGEPRSTVGFLEVRNSLGFGTDDDGVLVQFVAVENDSRCPADVQCIRAGEAFVVLSTTVDTDEPVESRLEITPGGNATVVVDRFTITIEELRPDPPPAREVQQIEYEIVVRVEESRSGT